MKVRSAALCILTLCAASLSRAAGIVSPAVARYPPGLLACPTTVDRIGRIIAPVMIDGTGPYPFLVDTGANYSMISPVLAMRLNLHPRPDALEKVVGITGTQRLPWVHVANLRVGGLQMSNLDLPITKSPVMDGLDGILGLAALSAERIVVNFRDNLVWIGHTNEVDAWGYISIPARRTTGGLLRVDARIGNVPVIAIIDTGSPRTMGNYALQRVLLRRATHGPDTARIFGVTRQVSWGSVSGSPTIHLGPVVIRHLNIVYDDLPIFKVWHLEYRPALVIGMDVLGTVDALILDYHRSHVYLMPRRPAGVEVIQADPFSLLHGGGGP